MTHHKWVIYDLQSTISTFPFKNNTRTNVDAHIVLSLGEKETTTTAMPVKFPNTELIISTNKYSITYTSAIENKTKKTKYIQICTPPIYYRF